MFKPIFEGLASKHNKLGKFGSHFLKKSSPTLLHHKTFHQLRTEPCSQFEHFHLPSVTNLPGRPEKPEYKPPSCEKVLKNMFLITYEEQRDLSRAFLRFQEFYESPVFRKKYFTLEEFKRWYTLKFGKFTYETDWIGFNIPSCVFEEFEKGKMNPLSREEISLLDLVSSKPKPFYIIGSTSSILDRPALNLDFIEPQRAKLTSSLPPGCKTRELSATLIHEMSHGLYYLDPEYSRNVKKEVSSLGSEINPLYRTFEQLGYHSEVWVDEAAAYLISECQSHPALALNGIDINEYPWCELRPKLQELFSSACNNSLRNQP